MNAIPAQYQALFEPYMRNAPVDVLGCAKVAGLPVYSVDLPKGVSGLISKNPSGDFYCYVDSSESAVRQRFTAAHELGHFVLHRDKIGDGLEDNYLLRAAGMTNAQEAQANRFAADLLMPRELITAAIAAGYTTASSLAKLFQVSEIAMSIRLGLPT